MAAWLLRAWIAPQQVDSDEYLAWRLDLARTRLLIAGYFCVAGNIAFAALDLMLYGDLAVQFLTLRALMTIVAILSVLLNATLSTERRQVAMLVFIVWGECFPICVMTSLGEGFRSPYYAGLMLVLFGYAILVPVRWLQHAIVQIGVLIVYWTLNIPAVQNWNDVKVAIGSSYFLLWTCALATASVILYERLLRKEFRVRQELKSSLETVQVEKQRAELANIAKTKFLAAANHDLRQPLQALNWYLGGLQSQTSGTPLESSVVRLQSSVDAMNQLFNGLLDVSRLDAGGVRPEITVVSLRDVFKKMQLQYEPLMQAKRLKMPVADTQALVRVDPLLLEQLLGNLLSNAIRHTKEGHVALSASDSGGRLRIAVVDTGEGIPAQHLQDIFQEFFQVGNSGRDRRKGLGLGLAIVKRLSELLGYDIQVRSVLGKGSEFYFSVPLAQSLLPVSPPAKGPDCKLEGALLPRFVAVVDDDPEICESIAFLLKQWGCLVVTATTGWELLNKFEGQEVFPDVLITDYRLSEGETGIDVIEHLSRRIGHRIPAVIVTGDTAADQLRYLKEMGFPVLHKPVSPEVLREILATLGGNDPDRADTQPD
jgi:signal transduction histidine kinase/CheY-like chemotaxis protein